MAATTASTAAQLVQLAQQEIHHCHLQRQGLDLHLSALESLLSQVADAFKLEPNLISALPTALESQTARSSSQATMDPPGFPSHASLQPQQPDRQVRPGSSKSKRGKKARATAASIQPTQPVQILKAPARSQQVIDAGQGAGWNASSGSGQLAGSTGAGTHAVGVQQAGAPEIPKPNAQSWDNADDDNASTGSSLAGSQGQRSAATSESRSDAAPRPGGAPLVTQQGANGHVGAAFDMDGPVPSLWVGSLPPRIDRPTVEQLFRYTPVHCKIVSPPGRAVAFAIVMFADADQTRAVLADNNTIVLQDRLLPIKLSTKPPGPRRPPPRRYNG